MTTDAMGYILGLLTLGMSMVAVRHRNMLLTLGTTALWVTLLNFILANNTAGLGWLSLFIISSVTFMAAFALISFVSRRVATSQGGALPGAGEEVGGERLMPPAPGRPGMMELGEEEYRTRVRRALHPRRRR